MLGFWNWMKGLGTCPEIIINDYSKLYIQLIASKEKKLLPGFQRAEIMAKDSRPLNT